ncbi:hypothetical protein PtB15_5B9 [Puccinia triticina]|nr:hypothetical protein PtB15_5B9 [Puccinia triticina]
MTFPNQVNQNGQGLGSFSSQLTGACQPVFHVLNQTFLPLRTPLGASEAPNTPLLCLPPSQRCACWLGVLALPSKFPSILALPNQIHSFPTRPSSDVSPASSHKKAYIMGPTLNPHPASSRQMTHHPS